jgi:hypothetical protein
VDGEADPRCAPWRRRILEQALDPRAPRRESVRRHVQGCPACAAYQGALELPVQRLDQLFAPVAPPERVWRRLARAVAPRRRRVARAFGALAGALALVGAWAGVTATTSAAVHADETTLLTAVWASHPAIAGYETVGIATGPWPSSLRGAGLVCRLADGRWLVSVLLENVPPGWRLGEEVVGGGRRITRPLAPGGRTVLDVVDLPATAPAVNWVGVWHRQARGRTLVAGWQVRLSPAPTGAQRTGPAVAWRR